MSDDCTVKHPPLTGLDHASMAAAYEASFVGAFGRKPRWTRGSGQDDGEYWIGVSDHYGAFGDGICRAGWNRYWELKLTTGVDALDPTLGDQPAHFLPNAGTVLPNLGTVNTSEPLYPPPPAPLPNLDVLGDVLALLHSQYAATDFLTQNINGLIAAVDALKAKPAPSAPIYVGRIFGYTITLTPQEKA